MGYESFHGRRARHLENDALRITLLVEGGHLAEILDKASQVNPLWIPQWPSLEPSAYDRGRHPMYGGPSDGKLLAGIMGHNLCLDVFGPGSEAETAAGLTAHGESSVAAYSIHGSETELFCSVMLPGAQLHFIRRLRLAGRVLHIHETVENIAPTDRPIAWTQHVTLGAPFLVRGQTQFRATATRSKTMEADFTTGRTWMPANTEFDWPLAPRAGGGVEDMRVYTSEPVSGGYTAHLMDPAREHAWFAAWSPESRLAVGYVWKQSDFPWMGIWEENGSRPQSPWNGRELTRGMEFGVSPYPEPRRAMIERGRMFGVPCYRWLDAKGRLEVNYCAFLMPAERIPEAVTWRGESIEFD